jgi:hypothetical protein
MLDDRPARTRTGPREPSSVVLVEGESDKRAMEALALRLGRTLEADGIRVVPIGGAKNITRALKTFGPLGLDVRLAGLCDAAEEVDFRHGLERAGLGTVTSRSGLDALGFYVCDADLEDELIRALGAAAVERIIDAQGELAPLRTFRKQAAQQGKTPEQQLRRFMGTRGGRKLRYATLLVDALDLSRIPRPLDRLLARL